MCKFTNQNPIVYVQKEIKEYENPLKAYRQKVTEKMAVPDLNEYNEVFFYAHSCAIEGNSISVNDTRELKEKGLGIIPQEKTLFEAFECQIISKPTNISSTSPRLPLQKNY